MTLRIRWRWRWRWWRWWWCSMRNGRSSTRGRYSRRCHTCCVLATVAILHTVQSTSGWLWSAWWPVQRVMLSSLVIRLPSFNPSTRPNVFTEKR